ncbi:unnamed protein product [Staurois parvus]|uniref:SGNH hydrolase-type esterase domain-containing protein n=1 Tax=Staurois parvus TaxID=386267 RepID=A0ABN9H5U1_9NEOB|nr:unnamed protein product [Staurois parvus]
MYVKWFDTVMLYYVILVNVTFCHFQISRRSVPPYVSTLAGDGTRMTDAGISRITLLGDTAGGTSRESRTR